MADTIFVKPIEGATVRYPRTFTPLPESGAEVPYDASSDGVYWRRRVNDGSVVVVPVPESKPAVSTTADKFAETDTPSGIGKTRRG